MQHNEPHYRANRVMLTVERIIEAPPAVVWDLFVDLDAWPRWGPPIRRAELDDPHETLTLHSTGTVYTWLPVALLPDAPRLICAQPRVELTRGLLTVPRNSFHVVSLSFGMCHPDVTFS